MERLIGGNAHENLRRGEFVMGYVLMIIFIFFICYATNSSEESVPKKQHEPTPVPQKPKLIPYSQLNRKNRDRELVKQVEKSARSIRATMQSI